MFNKKKIKELGQKIEELECKISNLKNQEIKIKKENKKGSAGMTITNDGDMYTGCLPDKEVSIKEALQLVVNYLDIRYKENDKPKLIKK